MTIPGRAVYTDITKGAMQMPESEAQKRAREKYDSRMTVQVHLKLNVGTDSDVIKKLGSVPNKQGYIKDLIRKDIKR